MMQNPLSPERLDKLQADAKEFLKDFSLLYLKNYGGAILDSVKEELEKPEVPPYQLKLSHREWTAVERDDSYSGYVYMQKGAGPGDFSDWKKVFLVERNDYQIDVFDDEKKAQTGKNPQITIQPAGYKLVTDVREHFRAEMHKLAAGLHLSDEEADAFTADMSSCSWALTHPQRINYIFQMKAGSSSGMMCCKKTGSVQPTNDGALDPEEEQQKNAAIEFMQQCLNRSKPRNTKTTEGMAFQRTCEQLPSEMDLLKDWTDDGTESEILVDLLMEVLLPELRTAILEDLKGPTVMKIKLWYKTLYVIYKTLLKLVDVAWEKAQEGINQLREKIEPHIRAGLAKIIEVKMAIEKKIKELIVDKIGAALAEYVTPFIEPLLSAFEKPLQDGFKTGRTLLSEKGKISDLPKDVAERNAILDKIPRDKENNKLVQQVVGILSEALDRVRSINSTSEKLFEGLDPKALQNKAETTLFETLDAAVYTLEQRLDSSDNPDAILEQLLEDYDHDVMIARSLYVKDVVVSTVLTGFKRLVEPVTQPIMDQIKDAIPEEMNKFLNIEKAIDDFLHFFVAQPIEQMIEKAYPFPQALPPVPQ
jgi:hypothetical protein